MYSWNVKDVDLTGNDRKDIIKLSEKIKEINREMRSLTKRINKEALK